MSIEYEDSDKIEITLQKIDDFLKKTSCEFLAIPEDILNISKQVWDSKSSNLLHSLGVEQPTYIIGSGGSANVIGDFGVIVENAIIANQNTLNVEPRQTVCGLSRKVKFGL
jgi:hypothetical protein